jgi:two-component system, response regulator PdtaR
MTHAGWRKTALVVDDEAFARLFAMQVLLDQGYMVLEAADVNEGLEVLDGHDDVAVLFTDISMPGDLDGLDLVDRVRLRRPDIGLIVTSGRSQPEEGRLPEGASFLPKPYTAHALIEAVRSTTSVREYSTQ